MFGYIKPYKMEMKLRDIKQYQTMYCCLCNQLKKDYGFISRFFLSYDVTFLLIFLNSILESEGVDSLKFRCPYNLFRKIHITVSSTALHYAAFINYWLVTEKMLDDYHDDKSVFRYVTRKALLSNKLYKKSLEKYEENIKISRNGLYTVYELEKIAKTKEDFDRLSNEFGAFFASLFDVSKIAPDTKNSFAKMFANIFFQVGKWIYIMDAFEDYNKDIKKRKFNLLLLLGDEVDNTPSAKEIYEKTHCIHIQIISKINRMMKIYKDEVDPCIDNVLRYGMNYVFYSIKNKKYKDCEDSLYGADDFMEYMEKRI